MAGTKNFGFGARRKVNAKDKKIRADIAFRLDGPKDVELFVRGDADADVLAVMALEFGEAEASRNDDEIRARFMAPMNELFPPETVKVLMERVKNKSMKMSDLGEVIEWATAEVGGRPTTSSST